MLVLTYEVFPQFSGAVFLLYIVVCFLCFTGVIGEFYAQVKRRTSHEPNRLQMRKTLCSPSLAFDLAHVKGGV